MHLSEEFTLDFHSQVPPHEPPISTSFYLGPLVAGWAPDLYSVLDWASSQGQGSGPSKDHHIIPDATDRVKRA